MTRLADLIRSLLFLLFATPMLAAAQSAPGIGILQLETAGDSKIPVVVWYPATVPTVDWKAGPYTIHATRNAPVAPGRHPFILVSHGSGGSEFGHADLAEALARNGYVVAAPRHLGDSYDQPDGRGTDAQLVGRPRQAVATLDAVLADTRLADAIDAARIGMAGFSAGGYTTLVLAGAKPDRNLFLAYCEQHADDHELCAGDITSRLLAKRAEWPALHDERVRAAVAMAPLGVMFDARRLADVTIPLRIYKADNDQVLRNAWNSDHVVESLPRRPEFATIAGGHYVFLAPCSESMIAMAPEICVDAKGVDRLAEHARMNREIVQFFDKSL
jgi:predicted dienelactone hydrolase